MQNLIVDIITGLVKVIKTNREALAADLREIADSIEAGELVPAAAFERAKTTLNETEAARGRLT